MRLLCVCFEIRQVFGLNICYFNSEIGLGKAKILHELYPKIKIPIQTSIYHHYSKLHYDVIAPAFQIQWTLLVL